MYITEIIRYEDLLRNPQSAEWQDLGKNTLALLEGG